MKEIEPDNLECANAGDCAAAIGYISIAAGLGNAGAQFNLGKMYRDALIGEQEDYVRAVFWFRKAAEAGHVKAQTATGAMLFAGKGVKQDCSEAAFWFRKAAEADEPDAWGQHFLGYLYEYGSGVKQDLEQAVLWYGRAAENGHPSAREALDRLRAKR